MLFVSMYCDNPDVNFECKYGGKHADTLSRTSQPIRSHDAVLTPLGGVFVLLVFKTNTDTLVHDHSMQRMCVL